jgi:hypothetical protein
LYLPAARVPGSPPACLKSRRCITAARDKPLAIANGITVVDCRDYLPYITWHLVATGINLILTKDVDFYNLDPILVARLPERLSAEGKLLQAFSPLHPCIRGIIKGPTKPMAALRQNDA